MKLLNLFAAKSQEDTVTSGGRSMVEMLGVLAIIGVLSVGGIVGYNTAMYKHRMNKTIQTFSALVSNSIELSNKKWGGGFYGRTGMLASGLLSEEQCPVSPQGSPYCKFPVGDAYISLSSDGNYPVGQIFIFFSEGDSVKTCVDFLSQGWQNIFPPEWKRAEAWNGTYISVSGNQTKYFWAVKPNEHMSNNGAKKDNITLSDVQTACDTCKGASECSVWIYINW